MVDIIIEYFPFFIIGVCMISAIGLNIFEKVVSTIIHNEYPEMDDRELFRINTSIEKRFEMFFRNNTLKRLLIVVVCGPGAWAYVSIIYGFSFVYGLFDKIVNFMSMYAR